MAGAVLTVLVVISFIIGGILAIIETMEAYCRQDQMRDQAAQGEGWSKRDLAERKRQSDERVKRMIEENRATGNKF